MIAGRTAISSTTVTSSRSAAANSRPRSQVGLPKNAAETTKGNQALPPDVAFQFAPAHGRRAWELVPLVVFGPALAEAVVSVM
jgi:hypothetical protein